MRSRLVLFAAAFVAGCVGSSPTRGNDPPTFPAVPLATTSGQSGAVTVDVRTAPAQPPTRGVLDVELTVKAGDGAPLDGLTIGVVPWMSAHGHGSSVTPTITPEGGGRYWVSDVDLYMPGEWFLRISISGAVTDEATATLEVE